VDKRKFIAHSFYSKYIVMRYKDGHDGCFYQSTLSTAEIFFKNKMLLSDISHFDKLKIQRKELGRELKEKEMGVDEILFNEKDVTTYLRAKILELKKEVKKPKKFNFIDEKSKNRLLIYYYLLMAKIESKHSLSYLKFCLDNDLDWLRDLPEMILNMSKGQLRLYLERKGIFINEQGEINVKSMWVWG